MTLPSGILPINLQPAAQDGRLTVSAPRTIVVHL
jgi:hypothetical protein